MFAILNKTERLITTHLGDQLPPGLPVAVSEVTMEHPDMQAMSNAGAIEVVEIQDPPPPDTLTGGNGNDTTGGGGETLAGGLGANRVGGGVHQPNEPVRANNPPTQQPAQPRPPGAATKA